MNWIYWLPTFAFLVHVIEEFGRFPSWASRHFGRTSRAWYVYSHLVLISFFVTSSWFASISEFSSIWVYVTFVLQWVIGTNAFFHLFVTFWYREYSPGVVTGTLVVLPSTWWMARHALNSSTISSGELLITFFIGTIISVAVIASLKIDFDIDWRGRKKSKKTRNRSEV